MQGRTVQVNVFAYFDASPNLPDQGQIIRLWHDSWKRHGWTPRLLHPRNAQRHLWWEKALEACRGAVPPNLARWFALDAVEGHSALLVEYDVLNFGLTPRRMFGPMSFYGPYVMGSSRPGRRLVLRAVTGTAKFPRALLRNKLAVPYLSPGWDCAPLVHFSRGTVQGPKHRAVLDCGRKLF